MLGGKLTRGGQKRRGGGSGERGRERPGRVGNFVGLNIYNRPVVRRSWPLSLVPHPEQFSFQIVSTVAHVRVLARLFSAMTCWAPYPSHRSSSSSFKGQSLSVGVPYPRWRGLIMKTCEENLALDATYSRSSSFQGTPLDRPYVMIVFP